MLGKVTTSFLLVGLAVVFTQCQSLTLDMRKSGTLPRIEVEGVFLHELEAACTEVLSEHDFRFAGGGGTRLIYEKPGSAMDFLAWGGVMRDDDLIVRLAIHIRELGADSFDVECQPFIVTDAGKHMEEARKVSRLQSGKYQKLLDAVKERALANRMIPEVGGGEWY